MASKNLEITKEKVLKASEKCPDAKGVLKELFPDVFKEDGVITEAFKEETKEFLRGLGGLVYEIDKCDDMIKRAEWIVGKFLYCHVPGETLRETQDRLVKKYKL